jgi:hypothetical protein
MLGDTASGSWHSITEFSSRKEIGRGRSVLPSRLHDAPDTLKLVSRSRPALLYLLQSNREKKTIQWHSLLTLLLMLLSLSRNCIILSAVCNRTKMKVAIKAYDKKQLTPNSQTHIRREATLLKPIK